MPKTADDLLEYFKNFENEMEELNKLDSKIYKDPELDVSIEILKKRIDKMTELYDNLIHLNKMCGGLADKIETQIKKEEEENGIKFKIPDKIEREERDDDLIQCMICGELLERGDKEKHKKEERHIECEKDLEKGKHVFIG